MSDLAPIVLFAFRRPLTTLQTLYTLSRCPEAAQSELHVFCDGPRRDSDVAGVEEVRRVVRYARWCGRVEIHEAATNRGLARSVIDGVSEVCAARGRVIVLEDDLLLARGLLGFLNEGLRRYEHDERVWQVSGFAFDLPHPEPRAAFLRWVSSQGWATWQRAWSQFQEVPRGLEQLGRPAHRRTFDLGGAYDNTQLMRLHLAGQLDSWAIRWWWTVHQAGGLNLVPLRTLVRNIGMGADATHTTGPWDLLRGATFDLDNTVEAWPERIAMDEAAFDEWTEVIRAGNAPPPTLRARVRARVGALARRVLLGTT